MLTLYKTHTLSKGMMTRLVAFINNHKQLYPHYHLDKATPEDIVQSVASHQCKMLLIVEPIKSSIRYTGVTDTAIVYTDKEDYDIIDADDVPENLSVKIIACIMYGYTADKVHGAWFNHIELDGNYLGLVRGGNLYKEVYPLLIKLITSVFDPDPNTTRPPYLLVGMDTCMSKSIPEYIPGAIPYLKTYEINITKYKLSQDSGIFEITTEPSPLISNNKDSVFSKRTSLQHFVKDRVATNNRHIHASWVAHYCGPAPTINNEYFHIYRDGNYVLSFSVADSTATDITITSILLRPDLTVKDVKYRHNLKSAIRRWALSKGIESIRYVQVVPPDYDPDKPTQYEQLITEFGYRRSHLNYYYMF